MFRRAAFLVVLVASASVGYSQTFTVTLSGSREAPSPGDPDGSGLAVLSVEGTTISYYIWVKGMEAPITSHIHQARAGKSGDAIISFDASFTPKGVDTFLAVGSGTVSDAKLEALLSDPGAYYLDVHDASSSGVVVRGQLLGDGPNPVAFRADLEESDGGFLATYGEGTAVIILDGATIHYYLRTGNSDIVGIAISQSWYGLDQILWNGPVTEPRTFVFFGSISVREDVAADIRDHPDRYFVEASDVGCGCSFRGRLKLTETDLTLPVAAHNPGRGTSFFRTDVRLQSLGDVDTVVWAEWYPANSAGLDGPAAVISIDVAPERVVILDDVVESLFETTGRGAVRFLSASPFHAVANTYNDQRASGAGTYGQFTEALGPEGAYSAGSMLLGSHRERATGIGHRLNLGYFNPNPVATNVTFNVRQPSGKLLASRIVTFPPYSNSVETYWRVIGQGEPAEQDDFFITYSSDGPVYLFGSLVDNVTDDGLYQPALPIPAALVKSP